MPRRPEEVDRERRIREEILADAYGEEQAIAWYCYLQQSLTGPVTARCVRVRSTSPLRIGEQVVITGMASEDDCQHDMVVLVSWQDRVIGVPLAQLEPAGDTPEDAGQSVDDWRHWVDRGYSW